MLLIFTCTVDGQKDCVLDTDTTRLCDTDKPIREPVSDPPICTKYRICAYSWETLSYSVSKICTCPGGTQYESVSKRCVGPSLEEVDGGLNGACSYKPPT